MLNYQQLLNFDLSILWFFKRPMRVHLIQTRIVDDISGQLVCGQLVCGQF
jgi:hypothetical protein